MSRANTKTSWFRICLPGTVCLLSLTGVLFAQADVAAPVRQLSFDRPESWALKYFTSVSLLSGLQTTDGRQPGSVAIGLAFRPSAADIGEFPWQ